MLQALPLPAPDLIRAAATRLGGKAGVAGEALCKGLRVYPKDGGFQVDSFTTDDRYFVKDGVCTCPAFKHGRGGCKHSCIPALLELAQTLTAMDLVSYTCVECKATSASPGLCSVCLHPATMPALPKKSPAIVMAEMDELF